jgi:hypothetical protein
MERTSMNKFCQVGNLKALLEMQQLPPSMDPFVRQLQAYYNPIPFTPVTNHRKFNGPLND